MAGHRHWERREGGADRVGESRERRSGPPCRGPFRGRLGIMSTCLCLQPHVGGQAAKEPHCALLNLLSVVSLSAAPRPFLNAN